MATISGQRSLVGLASLTSANGAARNGATLQLGTVAPGSLLVDITFTLVTALVVGTAAFQVSDDGVTFRPLATLNNAAFVNTTAAVTTSLVVPIPDPSAFRFFRVVLTLSGATTAAGDLSVATYKWRKPGYAQI